MKKYAPVMMTFLVILGLSALLSFWLGNAWYVFPLMIILLIASASAILFAIGIISVEFSSTDSFGTKERWFAYTVFYCFVDYYNTYLHVF